MPAIRPEVQVMLDSLSHLEVTDFTDVDVAQMRGLLAEFPSNPETVPDIEHQFDESIPGPAGEISIRIYRSENAPGSPALMWFHGGGWVMGDISSGDIAGRDLANRTGCVVVSVDYRLAPEAPFPAAFDDCRAATHWVLDRAAALGIDASRVAVGGDSAGGNLAGAVAIDSAIDRVPLAGQLLACPVTTFDPGLPSMTDYGTGYLLTRQAMAWFWDHYAQGADRTDRRIAPLDGLAALDRAAARRLAPAWIYTAGLDPLRDEGRAYAVALGDLGVDVTTMHVADVIHGVFSGQLECGAEARTAAADWLRSVFAEPALGPDDDQR